MRAVLVFCEGSHDVRFIMRSLGTHAGGQFWRKRIGDLPTPFGNSGPLGNPGGKCTSLIVRRYAAQSLDDRTLGAAPHAIPPVFEAVIEENSQPKTFYVLLRCGGQDALHAQQELLTDIQTVQSLPGMDIQAYAAAFFYDANGTGVTAREHKVRSDLMACFGNLSSLKHAGWVKTLPFPAGLYVWHDPSTQMGTLDEHVWTMAQSAWPTESADADKYLRTHAVPSDPVSQKSSSWQKAAVTIAGQPRCPGDPLSEVIGRKGFDQSAFQQSALSKDVVTFLQAVPW